jgi:hypothetical protein
VFGTGAQGFLTAENPADAVIGQVVAEEGLRLRKQLHTHLALEIVSTLAKALKK